MTLLTYYFAYVIFLITIIKRIENYFLNNLRGNMMNENEEENKMMVIKENKKVNYITLLSVISAIAVIIDHVKGGNIEDFSATTLWRNINIIEGIVHFAVPIFFMISGATLIDYRDRYSTKEFLKRRFKKTVIPFLFWSYYMQLLSEKN